MKALVIVIVVALICNVAHADNGCNISTVHDAGYNQLSTPSNGTGSTFESFALGNDILMAGKPECVYPELFE
jgi:hypothetical protein